VENQEVDSEDDPERFAEQFPEFRSFPTTEPLKDTSTPTSREMNLQEWDNLEKERESHLDTLSPFADQVPPPQGLLESVETRVPTYRLPFSCFS